MSCGYYTYDMYLESNKDIRLLSSDHAIGVPRRGARSMREMFWDNSMIYISNCWF